MSGTFKFKRFYSEGVAAEHPDIAGQKEFANKADAEVARRRAARAKKAGPQLPGFVASVKKEEVEVSEAKVDNSLSRSEKETARNKRAGITNNPYIGNERGQNRYRTDRHMFNWGEKKQRGKKEDNWTKTKFIRDKTGKVTKYQDWHVSNQNDRRARIETEEFELGEKIDVGADVSKTISDFVHSKNKTFKGDSKKQRINRALGAYYGAQKEEKKFDEGYMPPTQKRADKMMKQSSKLHHTGSERGDFGHPEAEKKHTQASNLAFMSRRMSDKAKERDNEARKKEFKEQLELQLRAQNEEKEMKGKDPCWKNYKMVGTKKKGSKTVPNCVQEEIDYSSAYDYVIEILIECEFVEDVDSAENMFDALSEGFVSVILEEYIEEKARGTRPKKTVHAYDVDETLFSHGKKGKPNVKVHVKDSSGKRVKSLSNQEFNTHKLDKGHSYDFSEFQSAKKFKETSSPNKKVIKDIKRKQARGQNVHVITARSKFDKPKEFHGHLKKHGVDVPMNKIHYTGGMKGGDIGKKKVDVANAVAKQSGAKKTHMYDDAAKVHKAFEAEKKNKPTSKKIKTHMVAPDKKTGESKVRSYQATKEQFDMTPYEYWKQYIA
jgi:hypothetical protein